MCHIIIMPIIIYVTIAIVCHDFNCDYSWYKLSFESEILLAQSTWLFCFGLQRYIDGAFLEIR